VLELGGAAPRKIAAAQIDMPRGMSISRIGIVALPESA
jgi:hypothetical protein